MAFWLKSRVFQVAPTKGEALFAEGANGNQAFRVNLNLSNRMPFFPYLVIHFLQRGWSLQFWASSPPKLPPSPPPPATGFGHASRRLGFAGVPGAGGLQRVGVLRLGLQRHGAGHALHQGAGGADGAGGGGGVGWGGVGVGVGGSLKRGSQRWEFRLTGGHPGCV